MSIDPELRKGICSITGGEEMLRKARKATKNLRRMKEEQVLVTRAKYLPQGNRTSHYKRNMLKSTHEIPADNMKCAHQTTNTRAASRKINRRGEKKNTKYKENTDVGAARERRSRALIQYILRVSILIFATKTNGSGSDIEI
jgi:hypothetical protein